MSEMKFEDTRGYGGSLGKSNTLDSRSVLNNGNAINDRNVVENTARTAVQNPSAHGAAMGLSLSQQQKLLKDMETLQKRLEREMLERSQLEAELAERNRRERDHLEEEAKKELERRDSKEMYTANKVAISNWFLTICYLKIPVVNIIYVLCTLISRKSPQPKKAYVLAWAVFSALCLALAALLIYFVIQFGADFIDNMLKYIPH